MKGGAVGNARRERAEILASLAAVDAVVIFQRKGDVRPIIGKSGELFHAKGTDYTVRGSPSAMKSRPAEAFVCRRSKGHSATEIHFGSRPGATKS